MRILGISCMIVCGLVLAGCLAAMVVSVMLAESTQSAITDVFMLWASLLAILMGALLWFTGISLKLHRPPAFATPEWALDSWQVKRASASLSRQARTVGLVLAIVLGLCALGTVFGGIGLVADHMAKGRSVGAMLMPFFMLTLWFAPLFYCIKTLALRQPKQ